MLAHREPATAPSSGSSRGNDAGYTLLELIIAVAVTGIIIVAIGYSVTESLSNTTRVRQAVDRSVLASLTAGVFTQDVANSTNNPPPASVDCGAAGTLAIGLPTSSTTAIEYVVAPGTEPGFTGLYRRSCNAGTQTDQQLLGQTSDAFTAVTTAPPCANNVCELTVHWTAAPDYSFTLRANRKVNT